MQVGQKVRWISQGRGSPTIKRGTIVRIVRKGEIPWKVAQKEFPKHQTMFDGYNLPGGKNAHLAFLIEVIKGPRAKLRLYMPFPCKVMRD